MATDYGLDTTQFRVRIVRPVLVQLDLWSISAENLVMGTGMHESHLSYLQQIKGPARGVFQMEPATYKDIWANFLAYQPDLSKRVTAFAIGIPDAEEMEGNLYFAVAMCRTFYRRLKAALPPAGNALAMAQFWKLYYNTPLGKGTVEQAFPHFERAVVEGQTV